MKLFSAALGLCLVVIGIDARAQSGIGTVTPDPDKALHVKAGPGQDPIRLEGIRASATKDTVVVTDIYGNLQYRPISDLTVSGEWRDSLRGTINLIYANQARKSGNDVVVTDAGRFGIGTAAPASPFQIGIGGDFVTAAGGGLARFGADNAYVGIDDNEIGAFSNGSPSNLHLGVEGASVVIGQNAASASLLDVRGQAQIGILNAGDLDGLNPADDQIVTATSTGLLRKVPASAINGLEWRNHTSDTYIYALRAQQAGQNIVVTDGGRMGIGRTDPVAKFQVTDGTIVAERAGTNVNGAIGNREGIRVTGADDEGDAILSTNSQNDFEISYNANANGGNGQFLSDQARFASEIYFDGDPNVGGVNTTQDGDAFGIRVSTAAGTAGQNITWRTPFSIENNGEIGIGTTNPQADFHINGPAISASNPESAFKITRNAIPTGVINNVPATDPEVLLLDPQTNEVKRIQAFRLFDDEGEWVDEPAGRFIYARKARETSGADVVVDDDGNMGFGRTNPTEMIHIQGGGIRIEDYEQGISFGREIPRPGPASWDGSRIYNENALGTWADAMVFEKTDFNHGSVDGGFAFATRQAGDQREIRMVLRGTGNVGIGTNFFDPRQRLHVIGKGLFQEGGTGNSADQGMVKIVDDRNVLGSYNRGVQVADEDRYAYFGMEPRTTGNDHDMSVMWGSTNGTRAQNQDLHFVNRRGTTDREVMMMDGQTLNVGIGTAPVNDAATKLHVGGKVRVDDLPLQGAYDEANDLIVIADGNGELQTVTAAVFKQDFEDLDWTIDGNDIYNANTGDVGVGVTDPAHKLDVGGTLRIRENQRAQFGNRTENRLYAANDNELRFGSRQRLDFVEDDGTTPIMTVRGDRGNVGIGTTAPNASFGLHLDENVLVEANRRLQFGGNQNGNRNDNYIYAPGDNDLRLKGRQRIGLRDDGDTKDVMTVHTVNERVGILNNDPQRTLDVNGRTRLRDLPAGDEDNDFFVTSDGNGDLRRVQLSEFEGPWRRSTNGAIRDVYLGNPADQVGIGLNNPAATLHLYEPTGTTRTGNDGTIVLEHGNAGGMSSIVFRSARNPGTDHGYIQYEDNASGNGTSTETSLLTIGVENDIPGSIHQDDIAIMSSGHVGVGTTAPQNDLHVAGGVRVDDLPTVNNTTDFAVTADANGDLRKQSLANIRDNLGDHDMDVPLATNGFTIKHSDDHTTAADDNSGGMRLTPQNSALFSNRLQIGNLSGNWIDDNITQAPPEDLAATVTNGFAGNDGAVFAPVRTRTENSDLRLYILDNPNDQFSIWGNPCPSADCGEINNSKRVASFRADGQIRFEDLRTGGGPNQMVVADAQGRLRLGGVPGSTTTGGGDNLGNHTATQNIILGPHQIRGQANGFRIEGNTGNINFPNGRGLFWGNIYRTAITGDVQANGEGGNTDLRFESGDDMFFQSRGGNGDFLIRTADYVARASNYMRFHVGTDNNNDDFRFYTESNSTDVGNPNHGATNGSRERLRIRNNGQVQVFDLDDPGNGNALVGVDEDGILQRITGSSDGLWDRDPANAETYLRNQNDEVGIGTDDPDAKLHLYGGQGTGDPIELRFNNTNGAGESQIGFYEGGGNTTGMQIRYDANTGDGGGSLQISEADGDLRAVIERNGEFGIGILNPATELHVMHEAEAGTDHRGLASPAVVRIQNEQLQGSAGIDFVEGVGNTQGRSMALRYHSTADGSGNHFEIVRGTTENADVNRVLFRVERDNGTVTVRDLATGAGNPDEYVVADANGVLATRPIAAELLTRDVGQTETYLTNLGDEFGIGTADPTAKLHVVGTARITAWNSGVGFDQVVTRDADGNLGSTPFSTFASPWDRDPTDGTYLANGADNVGIGTSTPTERLHVDGNVRVSALASATTTLVTADADGVLGTANLGDYVSHWRRNDAGAQDYIELVTAGDFVGIGTTSAPTAQLHTNGTVRFEALASNDFALVTDASGNVSTKAFPDTYWSRDAANGYTYTDFASDNVGIGTSTPSSKLHVASGQVTVTDLPSNTGDADADRIVTVDGSGTLRSLPSGTLYSPWQEDVNDRVTLKNNDNHVGIGTQAPISVLHVEDQVAAADGDMEVRFENRAGNGNVNLRFRTGANNGGFTDENNSMVLRYSNASDAMEITNGFASADVNYSSHFKVQRNGRVGINVGAANVPANRQFQVVGNQEIDGNLYFTERRRIQFNDANSFIADRGDIADSNLTMSAARNLEHLARADIRIRANDDVTINALGVNGDFAAVGNRYAELRAGENAYVRAGNLMVLQAQNDVFFRTGGVNRARFFNNGRFELNDNVAGPAYNFENDGSSILRKDVRMQAEVRADVLGGGGTQMVVADNNGVLGVQAVPTFTNTDDQDLALDAGTHVLSLTNDPTTVSLAAYLDNTDAQAISRTGNTLAITGSGSTVDLAAYLDNTDAQTLALSGTQLTISNVTGAGATVDLSGLTPTDVDAFAVSGSEATLAAGVTDVGIGTTAPTATLHVNGAARFEGITAGAAADDFAVLDAAGNLGRRTTAEVGDAIGMLSGALSQNLQTAGRYISHDGTAAGIYIDPNNRIAFGGAVIGFNALTITGDAEATGAVKASRFIMPTNAVAGYVLTADAAGEGTWQSPSMASDERLKTGITPMTGALEGIARLRNVTYRYRDDAAAAAPGLALDTATHYGLIAQDVAEVFPHAVTAVGDYLALEERELTGILFAAANELRVANEDLTARNERLERELADMRAAKSELERDVHSLTAETRELQANMNTVLRHIEASQRVQAAEH